MIYRYIVSRKLDDTCQTNSVMAGIILSDGFAIMGAGFDPFDPFAEFKVQYDLIDENQYSMYGGNLSEVVLDLLDIIEQYKSRFNREYKEEAV